VLPGDTAGKATVSPILIDYGSIYAHEVFRSAFNRCLRRDMNRQVFSWGTGLTSRSNSLIRDAVERKNSLLKETVGVKDVL
jgi:hypothetical protein